jgi:predicted transposase/invertase (TIGR01784 family)
MSKSKKFYPPRLDYVFKRIFGDKKNIGVLTAFLMAALGLPKEEFDHLIIVDPHLRRRFNDDKMGILDLCLYLKSKLCIDVEIQIRTNRSLRKRIAFTAAKMLSGQLKRGEEYQRIEPVVNIIICGDVLLPEEPGYYNTYSIRNVRSGLEFVDLLRIVILEPSKLPKEPDGEPLYNWGRFFQAETPEELAMIAKTDPAIKEAVALVMDLNEDEQERMLAERRWRWQMDQANLRRDSYEDGLADGEKRTEAKYQPALEAKDRAIKREIEAKNRAIEEKDRANRAIEELKRKLREAGIDA